MTTPMLAMPTDEDTSWTPMRAITPMAPCCLMSKLERNARSPMPAGRKTRQRRTAAPRVKNFWPSFTLSRSSSNTCLDVNSSFGMISLFWTDCNVRRNSLCNRPGDRITYKNSVSRISTDQEHNTLMRTRYQDGHVDVPDAVYQKWNRKTVRQLKLAEATLRRVMELMSASIPGVESAPCTWTQSQLRAAIALVECDDEMSSSMAGRESVSVKSTSPLPEVAAAIQPNSSGRINAMKRRDVFMRH